MGAAMARMFAREGAKVVIAEVLEHEGRQGDCGRGNGAAATTTAPTRSPMSRFVDSLLEGGGFEPSVPLWWTAPGLLPRSWGKFRRAN